MSINPGILVGLTVVFAIISSHVGVWLGLQVWINHRQRSVIKRIAKERAKQAIEIKVLAEENKRLKGVLANHVKKLLPSEATGNDEL